MIKSILRAISRGAPANTAQQRNAVYAEINALFPEPLKNPIPPVKLRRLAPNPDASWPTSESWLGGLPRLGDTPWPTSDGNRPLHHVASISLVEIAALVPRGKLPDTGALCFFCNHSESGDIQARVLHTTGTSDSVLPTNLSPIGEIFGDSERTDPARLDRYPIKLCREPWLDEDKYKSQSEAYKIWKAEFTAGRAPLYWDCAYTLLHGLKAALDTSRIARAIKSHRTSLNNWQKRLDEAETEQKWEFSRKNLENHRLALNALESKIDDFRIFVEAVEDRAQQHNRWDEMQSDDVDWLRDTFAQLVYNEYLGPDQNTSFGAIYRVGGKFLHSTEGAASTMYGGIVNGPASIIDRLPPGVLEKIGYDPGFAPIQGRHQMFGEGIDIHGDLAFYADHHLLLQIEYDQGAGIRIGDCGSLQFMIHPDELAARNWNAVKAIISGH